jgi:beta-lactam-binding protein with PASTA domain
MLSSVAIFGGSKGMVAMPDLSGLSRDAAIATVQSAGLVFSSSSNVDSTSGNNGKVVSQSIASGTLIDYESAITFVVGLYSTIRTSNYLCHRHKSRWISKDI